MDKTWRIFYSGIMLTGIRIYSSDPVWRQILSDLGATVSDAPMSAELNMDTMELVQPVSMVELKTAILNAVDNSDVLYHVFGRDVSLSRLHTNIVSILYKSGGMRANDLKAALGYSPDASTHAVDTAIYQLRKLYGRDFILNKDGVYSLGKL